MKGNDVATESCEYAPPIARHQRRDHGVQIYTPTNCQGLSYIKMIPKVS